MPKVSQGGGGLPQSELDPSLLAPRSGGSPTAELPLPSDSVITKAECSEPWEVKAKHDEGLKMGNIPANVGRRV